MREPSWVIEIFHVGGGGRLCGRTHMWKCSQLYTYDGALVITDDTSVLKSVGP